MARSYRAVCRAGAYRQTMSDGWHTRASQGDPEGDRHSHDDSPPNILAIAAVLRHWGVACRGLQRVPTRRNPPKLVAPLKDFIDISPNRSTSKCILSLLDLPFNGNTHQVCRYRRESCLYGNTSVLCFCGHIGITGASGVPSGALNLMVMI
jgi:hypothetical protein